MNRDPIDVVLEALLQAKPGMGICPAHDDRQQSLSVTTNEKGDVLLHCHAGCEKRAILDAVGLTLQDLFHDDKEPGPAKPQPVAWYPYTDEHEQVLYEVVRFVPKTFRQRRPDGKGDWVWNLQGVERVPYHLPDVLEAIAKERWIFFVEGEKDAETLTRMGFVATTTAGGSGSWSDSMAHWFKGARVVVVPDNDAPGREYAHRVARCLSPVAVEVRVLALPGVPGKGDVTDYMAASGTAEELKALVNATEPFGAVPDDSGPESGDRLGPLRYVRASAVATESVEWLWESRIPYGKITIMDGNPGQGKSTLSVTLAADVTRGRDIFPDPLNRARNEPHAVILLSAEDGNEDTIVPRLKMADADLDKVYIVSAVRPPDGGQERPWSLPGDLEHLRTLIVESGARLVVIDPITAFFDEKINANNDHHVRRALHPLKDLAADTGCAMVIVRHLKKSREGLAMHQGGGSIGIIGAARVGLVVAADPNDESGHTKVVAVSKNNLCPTPKSLKFHLENTPLGVAEVVWDGESQHSAETLLAAVGPDDVEETARCAEYLKSWLATHDLKVPELLKRCRSLGISDKVLNRAKKMLQLTEIVTDDEVWWGLDIDPSTKERP